MDHSGLLWELDEGAIRTRLIADSPFCDDETPLPYVLVPTGEHGVWQAKFEGADIHRGTIAECEVACKLYSTSTGAPGGSGESRRVSDGQ